MKMNFPAWAAVLAVSLAIGCSTGKSRSLSSVASGLIIPHDLTQGIAKFQEYIGSNELNRTTCAPMLERIYSELLNAPAAYFERQSVEGNASRLIEDIFQVRVQLRQRLGVMIQEGPVPRECVDGVRNILRAARFVEEYIAEWKLKPVPVAKSFTGGAPSMMVNPAVGAFEFRSGDVLLSRGNAVVSAAIARIGDRDGQFSHLAIVYIDEKTKKPFIVEAHIEVGVLAAPLETYLNDGKVRAAVFRQPDAVLAHQAGKAVYERAQAATLSGKNIPYDFAMKLNDSSELFCSEVPYLGYEQASQGQFLMPLYQTSMTMRNRSFLDAIGAEVEETFAPSDIEVDPRFEMVAEWRNFGKTSRARMLDLVLTQMFDWMERYDYVFKNSLGQKLTKNIAWTLRHLPLFEGLVRDKFPKNMKRSAVGAMMALDSVASAVLAELESENHRVISAGGLPMAARDMREYLEQFRQRDFEVWKKWRALPESSGGGDGDGADAPPPPSPRFHRQFNPRR